MDNISVRPSTQQGILTNDDGSLSTKHDLAVPACGDDSVLVRVHAVALNPSDYKMPWIVRRRGLVAGCDFAGVIIHVGRTVNDKLSSIRSPWAEGDRVCGAVHGSNAQYPHWGVLELGRGSLCRWKTPLSFDVSWWIALLGLATKGEVIVALQVERRDPRALTDLIVSQGITLTFAVPSESVAWLKDEYLPKLRLSRWQWHYSGGEPYSLGLIEHLRNLGKPDLRAINVYGPTETMIPTVQEVQYTSITTADMPVPIGPAMPNYSVYVVDERDQLVPAGISGQLVYGGAGIATGYVNNSDLTAKRFPKDKLARDEFKCNGWTVSHLSGDYGYLRKSDGVFVLQARIDGDTQVKLRGLRIDMVDIEANLVACSNKYLEQAIVHVRKPELEDTSSHYLTAHVTFSSQGESMISTEAAKRAFLADLVRQLPIPDYMRPARVISLQSLPLNLHGKIDRRAIAALPIEAEMLLTAPMQDETLSKPVEPRDDMATMREMWRLALGEAARAHEFTADSDFFSVGGNSLLLLQVQHRIKNIGVDVPVARLF